MQLFFSLFITFCLCWVQPVFAAELSEPQAKILAVLEQAPVVYLGEIHDHLADHEAEYDLLTKLYTNNQNLALGFEMFQRPFQPYLSRYLADEMTEEELQELSEYDRRWGFDWEYYAPLLRFAKAHQIPLVALNTPAEITNKVAVEGLDSLEEQDYRYIPARQDLDFSNQAYLDEIEASFLAHIEGDYGNQAVKLENFTAAQILWDETMAEAIADYLQDHPEQQFITFVGQAHLANNYGIPDRVARRIPTVTTQQKTVFLSSSNSTEDSNLADFLWHTTAD
ncbi:ChaN family lipoprotein [[Limnothrix rosea] IAM M-220]|uniref:ChaN family lipoprotein n=1 Tax=[Limnothrix rosea] IAM M-220 TaxID=454133 RepID=UPI00095EE6A1|nr:ChaN family lipoprotein [[Limnothrix rosea] IAM M-220]OKH12133.1 hypothetical protein NIES208_16520 [[Limnothrix rosea] IAM M-220]